MAKKMPQPVNLLEDAWPPRLDRRAAKAPKWAVIALTVLYAMSATWAVMSFPYSVSNVMQAFTFLVIVPGALFMLLMRTHRLWYAWVAVLALSWVTAPAIVPAVLLVGWIWIMLSTLNAMGVLASPSQDQPSA